ncbi:MAG TPA: glycerol-3-phosphate 1-O-acyltransferase PlsY [Bacteroidota bacterium]|jgi:glycerol-3-phosphate acyltransferase PlsY|nr:glycerol-3-phosphate 1-O-acyltransferase PlsY [Bacteroidota bacterium]
MYLLSLIIILSYIAGSIPTGLLVSRYFKGVDIRQHGSGNIGSTNVFRTLGWKLGMLVQVGDVLKGLFAVLVIARLHYGDFPFNNRTPFDDITIVQIIAGLAAVLGHIFSVFLNFKGGKGINTAAGMLVGIAPVDISIALIVFALVLLSTGYVSLGSLSAATAFPSTMFIRYNFFNVDIPSYHTLIAFSIATTLLLFYAHRANIQRLLRGQENRFNKLRILGRKMSTSAKLFLF